MVRDPRKSFPDRLWVSLRSNFVDKFPVLTPLEHIRGPGLLPGEGGLYVAGEVPIRERPGVSWSDGLSGQPPVLLALEDVARVVLSPEDGVYLGVPAELAVVVLGWGLSCRFGYVGTI